MALVITIDNKWELKERFEAMNRDYYSLEACEEIINYFDMYEENVELDIIAICCDFDEETPDYIMTQYDYMDDFAAARDENGDIDTETLMDALNDHTWAIELLKKNLALVYAYHQARHL